MQTQDTHKISSQSCLTANKRSRCSNNTERNHYGMQNSDVCSYTLQKIKAVQGYMFSNTVNIMIVISYVQYCVPITLCKPAGSIHLFKITGTLKPENVNLNQNHIWDTIEIDWKAVSITFNSNKINLPNIVMIKFRDKFKIRCMMK